MALALASRRMSGVGWMGEPTALTFAAAAVGWVVLGVVPGFLLASALTPSRSALDRLAVAPAVSIGIAYPAAAWANAVGLSIALPVGASSLFIVTLASAVMLFRRRARGGTVLWHEGGALSQTWPATALVGAMWMVAIATSTAQWGVVVPNSDGNSHGLAVVDLLNTGRVTGYDGYPLGMHVVAALVGALTSVPSSLVVPLTLLGGVWTVLGVAALSWRVSQPSVRWAAIVACAVPFFPFGQVGWGPVPLVLAVALVPSVALAVLDVTGWRAGSLATVAVAGIIAVHVTEGLVVGMLVGAVLVLGSRRSPRRLAQAALVGLVALVLVGPLVVELAVGGADRPPDAGALPTGSGLAQPISALVTDLLQPFIGVVPVEPGLWTVSVLAAGVLVVASAAGARAVWATVYGRAVVVLVVLCLLLALLAETRPGGLLTSPWYGNGARLVAQASALLPVLLGVTVARLVARVRAGAWSLSAAVLVGVALVASAIGALGVATQGLGRFSVVTVDDRLAFPWLQRHVPPGEEVLNDHRDGSVWMVEATSGAVVPVFGGKPGGGFEAYPEWAGRLYLQQHVAQFESDPRVRALAAQWHVRYVFVGERTFANAPRLLDVGALEHAPGVREVFHSGGARVFELPAS